MVMKYEKPIMQLMIETDDVIRTSDEPPFGSAESGDGSFAN